MGFEMKRRCAWALVGVLSLAPLGCGGPPPPAPSQTTSAEPRWQDVIDVMPELLVVVRPKMLRGDRVFGPLLKRAIDAARQHSKVVDATQTLETIEDAEEVVVGWRPETHERPGEFLFVERGVRADVDPAKLVDDGGQPLWSAGPAGTVRELVRERDEHGTTIDASLFEMPGRTWLVVTGPARARARDALAHPSQRPPLKLDADALALVRFEGPLLVAHVPLFQEHGSLGVVGRRLESVTLLLPPGNEGAVKVVFTYADEDAAAFSEVGIRQFAAEIAARKIERLAWLGAAQVVRPDTRVVVTAPLPPQFVASLLYAGSAPMDLDVPPQPSR
jgi:hypothetical protein